MKKIGIIGGIGWPSTIEYYKLIQQLWQTHFGDYLDFDLPEICIESINMRKALRLRGDNTPGSWEQWEAYVIEAIKNLELAQCDIIAMASVTPHSRLPQLQASTKLPILSVYDSVTRACKLHDIHKCLILGTLPTMTTPAFKSAMEEAGIEAWYPHEERAIQNTLRVIEKLYANNQEGTKEALCQIVSEVLGEHENRNTAVALGCTELSTAFPEHINETVFHYNGITFLNVFVAHVEDIVTTSLK